MPLAPGTLLGPYRIVSTLGSGGMGEVYRAEDPRLQRTVAVKVLPPGAATPDRVERFEQEARAASALNHPNILTIHDVGREGDIAYFAMEWVNGRTLRELLRKGPIPLRRSLDLAQQIAEGLARAHAAGIVHRDLKPENVMVTDDGFAKIVDFGLAKLHAGGPAGPGDQAPTVTVAGGTEPGILMGTVGYMSPEQAAGRPVDYRSDQFSLGLVIYELATRTRPFERASSAQSLAATIDADPPPIESLNAEVPSHLGAIVRRCLAKEPAERYESTLDLARDLKSITVTGPQTAAVPAVRRTARMRYIAAALVVLLLIAAAVGAWSWRSRSAAATGPQDRPLVAVRPFRNLSADPQQGFFAAGMTQEIRGQLSQVASLRLLSGNALDSYKDDVVRVVRELGVRNFVDGSVRVDGNRVRVSAELVDASSQQTVWSDQYDRNLADMLAVQSEIAVQIARALRASLSPGEQQRLEKRPTDNAEAYALYLRSQQITGFAREQNLEAMELLRKALALDPRFAVARARLAYRLVFMGYYDASSYIDEGIAEAEAALRTDPLLPAGHFALGTGYSMKGMEAQGRQSLLRALELDPNHTSAMANFSILELEHARLDEALYWGRRLFTLSGKRGNDFYHLAVPLINLRADAASRTVLEEGERRFPTFPRMQTTLAVLELLEGKPDQAVTRVNAIAAREPQNEEVKRYRADLHILANAPDLDSVLAPLLERSASNHMVAGPTVRLRYACLLAGRGEAGKAAPLIAEAERIAREKIDAGNGDSILRIEMAGVAALRRDTVAALDWLSRAYDAGYRDYGFLERDPLFAGLEANSGFREILDRTRKDVEAQRRRAEARGLIRIDDLLAPAQ
jgi:TolB-like protein/predicted Ser/Thr protein kinase